MTAQAKHNITGFKHFFENLNIMPATQVFLG